MERAWWDLVQWNKKYTMIEIMPEGRYLDPTNDVAFKKLFEDKTRLMSFLNAVLHLEGPRVIVDLIYLPQEEAPLLPGHKKGIVDVRCEDQAGHRFIVEMQNDYITEFLQRTQFYASYAYVSQLTKGTSHLRLKPVVLLAVVNYTLFHDNTNYLNFYEMRNTKTNDSHLKAISYAFIELPKFLLPKEKCTTLEEEWIYTLKNAPDEMSPPFRDEVIVDSYDLLERYNWSQGEYDAYLDAKIAADESVATQQEKYDEGFDEGRVEGIEEGRASIIRIMHNTGASIETIAQLTQLSEEQVKKLLHEKG